LPGCRPKKFLAPVRLTEKSIERSRFDRINPVKAWPELLANGFGSKEKPNIQSARLGD
jgi:hypothetical protein